MRDHAMISAASRLPSRAFLVLALAALAPGATGTVRAQGQPDRLDLRIDKGAAGDLDLIWQDRCPAPGTTYAIYEGDLGQFDGHRSIRCATAGPAAAVTPPSGDLYYLVVPIENGGEGSYGRDSDGDERPPGSGACGPQQSALTCPTDDFLQADPARVARLDEVLLDAGAILEAGGRFADVADMLSAEPDVANLSANGVSMYFTVGGLPTSIYDAQAARHGAPLNDVIPPAGRATTGGAHTPSSAGRLASGPVPAAAAATSLPRGQRMVGKDDDGDGKRDLPKHALILSPWAFAFAPNDSAPVVRDLLLGVRDYQEGSVTYKANTLDLLQDTMTVSDYTDGWDDKDLIFLSSHGDADPNAWWGPDPSVYLGIGGSSCTDIGAKVAAEFANDPENYPTGLHCSLYGTIGPSSNPISGFDLIGTRAFWEWAHGGNLEKKVIWMETCRSAFLPGLAEALTGPDSIFFGWSDYVRVSVSLTASEAVFRTTAVDGYPMLRSFVRSCGAAGACQDPPADPTRAVLLAAWDRADLRTREALHVPATPAYGTCAVSSEVPVEITCPSCGGSQALSFTYDIAVDGLQPEDMVFLQDPEEFGKYQLRLFADIDGADSGYATPLADFNMAPTGDGTYVNAFPISLFGDGICPDDIVEYDPWVLLPAFDEAMPGNDGRDRIYSWDGPFSIEIVPTVLP